MLKKEIKLKKKNKIVYGKAKKKNIPYYNNKQWQNAKNIVQLCFRNAG